MMKLTIRPAGLASLTTALRPVLATRSYATNHSTANSTSTSSRRSVTPFNDDGHVPWTDLSAGEKAARATQQSFNFGFVIVGIVLTGGVGYFLWQDVFSPDSKTAYYNRAMDRIKKDPRCLELLGESKKITGHGEETANKWRRARPIASTVKKDPQGNEHLVMHFHVEGPSNRGLVNMHLVKRLGSDEFHYKYFFLDVPGHQRVYLENDQASSSSSDKKAFKLFGVSWN